MMSQSRWKSIMLGHFTGHLVSIIDVQINQSVHIAKYWGTRFSSVTSARTSKIVAATDIVAVVQTSTISRMSQSKKKPSRLCQMKLTTLSEADFASFTGKDLIVKKGHLDDRADKIMLDSGATCNVVKPGLLQRVLSEMAI